MAEQIIILTPVFNDGESLNMLLTELAESLKKFGNSKFSVLIVDDGSTDNLTILPQTSFTIQILHLQRNIGHQKAIAIGLAYIKENLSCDKVLVMDSDGEDRPTDVAALLRNSINNPGKIIFAQRKSRQEGTGFRLFYRLYSEIWNHIAGGIMKTELPYLAVITNRGKRYAGKSKMNFLSLLMHGLGAIAVFIEVIASRLLIFSLLLIGISLLAILALLGIRTFTDMAIPGWTTTVASAMLIILLQSFLLSLFTIFLYLSSQSQRKFIPAHHYRDYTGTIESIQ